MVDIDSVRSSTEGKWLTIRMGAFLERVLVRESLFSHLLPF